MLTSKPQLPLRAGLIGLSASAVTAWASKAHLPGLLNARGQKDYKITALCNSSVSAAEAAIKAYDLPTDTKAYGNPADLANDADIDVVICVTRVDKHYQTIVDSVKAGKRVFVEWPVTSSVKETDELVELAAASGSQVAVGLQRRWAPPVAKLREIVQSGRLGKVLSSDVRAYGGTMSRDRVPIGLKYFGQKNVGGNPMTISFGHMIDFVQSVLGEFVEGTTVAKTQIQISKNKAFDPQTKKVVEEFQTNVPDLIVVSGNLPASAITVDNATLSVKFRRGQQFKDDPSLVWSIYCQAGEVRLVAPSGLSLETGADEEPATIRIHHFEDDSIEEVEWIWSDEQQEMPPPARNIMNSLYAFAEGDHSGWTTLESAARRARQIDSWVEKGSW